MPTAPRKGGFVRGSRCQTVNEWQKMRSQMSSLACPWNLLGTWNKGLAGVMKKS